MTEIITELENWKYSNITLKDLLELEFPLPQYDMTENIRTSFHDGFNISGVQASYR